jgi:hypothetical protein
LSTTVIKPNIQKINHTKTWLTQMSLVTCSSFLRGLDRIIVGFSMSSNLARWGVFDTTLYDKFCQWLAAGRWFFPSTPVSSTNKTDRQDITELLLNVALNTITLSQTSFLLDIPLFVILFLYLWLFHCLSLDLWHLMTSWVSSFIPFYTYNYKN